jgi:hypothetical protein
MNYLIILLTVSDLSATKSSAIHKN